jgi:hypothetical protein
MISAKEQGAEASSAAFPVARDFARDLPGEVFPARDPPPPPIPRRESKLAALARYVRDGHAINFHDLPHLVSVA